MGEISLSRFLTYKFYKIEHRHVDSECKQHEGPMGFGGSSSCRVALVVTSGSWVKILWELRAFFLKKYSKYLFSGAPSNFWKVQFRSELFDSIVVLSQLTRSGIQVSEVLASQMKLCKTIPTLPVMMMLQLKRRS